jgi:hypothetical protein
MGYTGERADQGRGADRLDAAQAAGGRGEAVGKAPAGAAGPRRTGEERHFTAQSGKPEEDVWVAQGKELTEAAGQTNSTLHKLRAAVRGLAAKPRPVRHRSQIAPARLRAQALAPANGLIAERLCGKGRP